jgi:hypothetical protein
MHLCSMRRLPIRRTLMHPYAGVPCRAAAAHLPESAGSKTPKAASTKPACRCCALQIVQLNTCTACNMSCIALHWVRPGSSPALWLFASSQTLASISLGRPERLKKLQSQIEENEA